MEKPEICQKCGYNDCNSEPKNYKCCPYWKAFNLPVQEVTAYKCPVCGKTDVDKTSVDECLNNHQKTDTVEIMWRTGKTLDDIFKFINRELPDHLKKVTNKTLFSISYIDCHSHYAYRIIEISIYGHISVRGWYKDWFGDHSTHFVHKVSLDSLVNHKEIAELTEEEKSHYIEIH